MHLISLAKTITEWVDGSIRIYYNNTLIARLEYDQLAQVRWIWVEPQYRRQGLAKLMLSEVERRTGLISKPLPPVSESARGLFR